MKRHAIENFVGGWFIGNFSPSLHSNSYFEVCLKRYPKGSTEPSHYQKLATEYTVIISGTCRVGTSEFGPNEIIEIEPGESAGFEALQDVVLVAIKVPSIPDDKVLEILN